MNSHLRIRNLISPNILVRSTLLCLAIGGATNHAVADEPTNACGYTLSTGITTRTRVGFTAWVDINNISGDPASTFEVLLDTGNTNVQWVIKADHEPTADGDYLITEPPWWPVWKNIDPGDSYRFRFRATPAFDYVTPYLLSINGIPCDTAAPEVELSSNSTFFSSAATLTLTASASDDTAVKKVVFERDGQVIGEDNTAPFELQVTVDDSLNGYQLYTATAYDPSGNVAVSIPERIFVAIGNKFIGTAPANSQDYPDLLTYFDQLTPSNAGKWGSVESERDVMVWDALDTAYQFAQDHGIAFKFHTLIWGQQQPAWLSSLTPEEQLVEIEQWLSLIAARYPELKMIDVVNEPLHAPPSYIAALGGAGDSGWDWVINSFALARQHFPHAQLILNDYQILIHPDFTASYLEIITLLQDRGLLDAIGLQSHFLERAELPVVAQNLDTLAATGLPLYISEFDLNVADDALHANKFRDLFTLFWENTSVAGITHWGHLQGNVWREDGYLLRQDGSQRPALDWLVCYLSGATDCPVPDYIPSGWQGDEFGLTLQAEEYDQGLGVLALGDTVAYTDDGDWIAFYSVALQSDWDSFWVSYAKGNETIGSISIHLDNPDGPALLTLALPPTAGGWGSTEEIEAPWAGIAGTHDIYVRFNDTYGVANLDSLRFGKPAPDTGYGPNLIASSNFENQSTAGWFSWDGTLAATDELAYAGDYSLKLSNRGGNGPAAYSLFGAVNAGSSYQVRLFASIAGAATADVNLTAKISCADSGDNYSWVIAPSTVTAGQWLEMTGILAIPDCELTDLLIFAEGPGGGIDIYLDEVSVREIITVANIFPNSGFEEGNTYGWYSWDGTIGLSQSQVHSGSSALEVSGRGGNGPAAYNWTSLVDAGTSYNVSMAVSALGEASSNFNVTQAIECVGDATQYTWLTSTSGLAEGEWAVLTGVLQIPDCELANLQIYLEGPNGGVNIYLDDIVVSPL